MKTTPEDQRRKAEYQKRKAREPLGFVLCFSGIAVFSGGFIAIVLLRASPQRLPWPILTPLLLGALCALIGVFVLMRVSCEHQWVEVVDSTTCLKRKRCSICGEPYEEYHHNTPLTWEHDLDVTAVEGPACLQRVTCRRCKKSLPLAEHHWGEWEVKFDGYIEQAVCRRCGFRGRRSTGKSLPQRLPKNYGWDRKEVPPQQ